MLFELAEVIGQQLGVGRMQFEQAQAVVLARDLVGHVGRARVVAHLAARIHGLDQVHVLLQRRRQIAALPQRADAGFVFGVLGGVAGIELVDAGARVGVDVTVGGVFLIQVLQQLHGDEVLQHIGVIARVEGVAVTKHRGFPKGMRRRRLAQAQSGRAE